MGRLEAKTAVISGASGGMGLVACRRFCEEGASVVGIDVAEERGRELEKELQGEGFDFEFRRVDVTSSKEIGELAEHVRGKFGGLDILYNNAGIMLPKPLLDTTEEEWDLIHNVDLKSIFLMTKAFAPLMEGRKASIINLSSLGGLVAFDSMTAYSAAKGGVVMFSKACALDLAPSIRVNAICPTIIDTPMARGFVEFVAEDTDALWKMFEEGHLLKRAGEPEEVVSLALFLASDESSLMTGTAIPIDGGWSVR